jgi:hypothetical protein
MDGKSRRTRMRMSRTMVIILSFSMFSGCVASSTSNFSGRILGKGKAGLDAGWVGFHIELSTLSGDTDFIDFEGPILAGELKFRF